MAKIIEQRVSNIVCAVVESVCRVNTLTKWWVEPNYVALPIPTCPLRCIVSVRKFVIKVKGVLRAFW
jgi:hypothetical protein